MVQEIGAAAGFAASVGLAALLALHISHARDIRRLREWADRAPGSAATPADASRRSQPLYGRIGTRHVAIALVGLLALGGAAAYGIGRLTGGDGPRSGVPDQPTRQRAAVKPGKATVAVLNGTTVPGLAAALRDQIAAAGFETGMIDTFADQRVAESVVQYAPEHRAAATAVSRRLGISRRAPITADSRSFAGNATVIVIAGADKAP